MKGKTILISGGSRGIGLSIAKRFGRDGANVVIAAKTSTPHSKLEGTIYTAAAAIEKAGGHALPLVCDVRDEKQVENVMEKTIEKFGGIDVLVNNASAIVLQPTKALSMKSFDLMNQINVRGTFLMSKCAMPYLKKSDKGHILTLSPPINLDPKWFKNYTGYTMAKYAMSMTVIGLAEELKKDKVCVNGLWPKTTIATAAIQNLLGGDKLMKKSRTPEIMADAAYQLVMHGTMKCTGKLFVDEDILRRSGVTDFEKYKFDASVPEGQLAPDLYL